MPMRLVVVGFLVLAGLVAAPIAQASVSITRADVVGTALRLEGTAAPNKTITVDGVAFGTSDAAGKFKIQRNPFTAPADCTVDVNDGSATPISATLTGCTVTSATTSPSLAKVSVSPTDVVMGSSATGTVTLTSAAPSGGVVVPLTSDNTVAATVPASVTVPAGSASASFTVLTKIVPNSQSALIIGAAGGVTTYAIITVWTPFAFANGSISILPGGNGSGKVTSTPAGIDCSITLGNGSGVCTAFFPVGTVVRLDARPAQGTSFLGWRGLPGCADPSKITVARGTTITCQPGFYLN